MSYLNTHHSLGSSSGAISLAKDALEDPCLAKVTQLALTLDALLYPPAPAKPGAPKPGAPKPSRPVKGIGLCGVVKPLNAAIYLKRNPWILPAAGAALFLGLFGLGYYTGRSRR